MRTAPEEFEQSLAETKAWVESQDPIAWRAGNFRTGELLTQSPYGNPSSVLNFDAKNMRKILNECVLRRRKILADSEYNTATIVGAGNEGKLLRHNLGESTNTCVPFEISFGFFDEWDMPPWDCWVALIFDEESSFGCLLSWIPAEWVEIANQVVVTSFEESNVWSSIQC